MKKMLLGLTLVALTMATGPAVLAQDFQKGFNAYRAGDYATALEEWKPLAEQGDDNAQLNLGFMYDKGQGVLQDYGEAEKWFRMAAEQGQADAQNALGFMYEYGNVVLQSNVMAHMWYNIASANGHSEAREYRDVLASMMSIAEITKAREMARKCMNWEYEHCGE